MPPTPSAARRDPVTRAYFRDLEPLASKPVAPAPTPDAARLLRLIEQATQDAPGAPRRSPRALLGRASTLVEALRELRARDARAFEERMGELSFLANVLVEGATIDSRRLRPAEASEAALATVALGAELEVRRRHGAGPAAAPAASAAELREVLEVLPADVLFRAASAALSVEAASPGFLRHRGELEAAARSIVTRADKAPRRRG